MRNISLGIRASCMQYGFILLCVLCVYYKGREGIPGHGSSFRSLTVSFAIASVCHVLKNVPTDTFHLFKQKLKIAWELEDLVSKVHVCTKSNINFFHCRV